MKRTRIALIGAAVALLTAFLMVFGWKRAAVQPPASFPTAAQGVDPMSNSVRKDGTDADNGVYESTEQLAAVYLEKLRESYKKYGRELSPDEAAHFRKVAAEAFKEYVKEYGRKPSHSDIKFTDKPPQRESRVEIDTSSLGNYDRPQTVEALMERYGKGKGDKYYGAWVEKAFPRKEWIQRALDLGIVFRDNHDYSGILNIRGLLARIRTHPESYADIIRIYGLEDDDKYNAYIDRKILKIARDNIMFREAARQDPRSMGGIHLADRIIPTRGNQVHVRIAPGDPNHAVVMYGPRDRRLTGEETHLLKYHGVAPEGIEVFYLDENNEVMPPDSKPMRLDWKDRIAVMSEHQRQTALQGAVDFLNSEKVKEMTIVQWMMMADYTGALLDYTDGGRSGVSDAPPVSPAPSGVVAPPDEPTADRAAADEQALPPLLPPGVELPQSPGKSPEDVDAFFDFLDLHLIENADVPENVRRGLKQRYEAYQMWKGQDRLRRQEPKPPSPPANEDGDTSDEEDEEVDE